MGGKPKTTDLLLNLVKCACRNDCYKVILAQIRDKHFSCLWELFGAPGDAGGENADELEHDRDDIKVGDREAFLAVFPLARKIESDLREIESLLHAIQILRMEDKKIQGLIAGYGEMWSASILALLMQKRNSHEQTQNVFRFLDARDVITLEPGTEMVLWDESTKRLEGVFQSCVEEEMTTPQTTRQHFVATGFIASYFGGGATTLGRDGSDYSASIFARLLSAQLLTIWTDVSGVMSADPRRVPDAYVLPDVSYLEATELAYFGAKVIHPKTMRPAQESRIPIMLKNTFRPYEDAGTRIYLTSGPVCGFNVYDGISLLNIECAGMTEVPGVFSRLFSRLAQDQVGIELISQAATEQSVCFAVKTEDSGQAVQSVQACFAEELRLGEIQSIQVTEPCSVVAAVGDGMRMRAGISGKFFHALGKSCINILAIAQGSSERNISAVVPSADAARALRAVHSEFLTKMNVGVVLLLKNSDTSNASCAARKDNKKNTTTTTSENILMKRLEEELKQASENSGRSGSVEYRLLGVLQHQGEAARLSWKAVYDDELQLNRHDVSASASSWPYTAGAGDSDTCATTSTSICKDFLRKLAVTAFKFAHQVIVVDVSQEEIINMDTGNSEIKEASSGSPTSSTSKSPSSAALTPVVLASSRREDHGKTASYSAGNSTMAKLHPLFLKEGFHIVSFNAAALGGEADLYKEILMHTRFLDEGGNCKGASHLKRKLSRNSLHNFEGSCSATEDFLHEQRHNRSPADSGRGGSGIGSSAEKHRGQSHLRKRRPLRPNVRDRSNVKLFDVNDDNKGDDLHVLASQAGGGGGRATSTSVEDELLLSAACVAATECGSSPPGREALAMRNLTAANTSKNKNINTVSKVSKDSEPAPDAHPPPLTLGLYVYGSSICRGALPFESTVAYLQNSGDRVTTIEGTCFAQGLAFLLAYMSSNKCRFVDALRETAGRGLLQRDHLLQRVVVPTSAGAAGGATKHNNSSTPTTSVLQLISEFATELSGEPAVARLVTVARRVLLGSSSASLLRSGVNVANVEPLLPGIREWRTRLMASFSQDRTRSDEELQTSAQKIVLENIKKLEDDILIRRLKVSYVGSVTRLSGGKAECSLKLLRSQSRQLSTSPLMPHVPSLMSTTCSTSSPRAQSEGKFSSFSRQTTARATTITTRAEDVSSPEAGCAHTASPESTTPPGSLSPPSPGVPGTYYHGNFIPSSPTKVDVVVKQNENKHPSSTSPKQSSSTQLTPTSKRRQKITEEGGECEGPSTRQHESVHQEHQSQTLNHNSMNTTSASLPDEQQSLRFYTKRLGKECPLSMQAPLHSRDLVSSVIGEVQRLAVELGGSREADED
ncbi:unnamed protein product [Amoebophrya sp. A25]|nr:unnamed protein product [Amoebophrya sp. A25]|eukprot:GSA25T00014677001.1